MSSFFTRVLSLVFATLTTILLAFTPVTSVSDVPDLVVDALETVMKEADIEVIEAKAAIAFPSLSESSYCECVAPKKIYCYMDKSLQKRGTCSPSKAYESYADKDDVLYVYEITSSYIKFSFPTPNGRRVAYGARKDLILVAAPTNVSEAAGKATTYVYPNGKAYGYYENGDKIFEVGTSGSFTATIYSAHSGKRSYKLGWAQTEEYKQVRKGSGSSGSSGNLSEALYKNSNAHISCGFDGYINQSGRHEGIDMKYKLDAPIYALIDGKVIRVASGSTGGKGLSTIAIYNATADKTVIYLHSTPCVKVGQTVSKGDKIGYESWRGISNKSSSHTHVEVRNGKREYAAKSVGDSKLDNKDPSSFWKSQGYKIK